MKIRKVFESDEYYQSSSWRTIKNQSDKRKLTSSEYSRIKKAFPNLYRSGDNFIFTIKKVFIQIGYLELKIRVDNDDYYYLKVSKFAKIPLAGYVIGSKDTYKCDQFDGLLECIKDILENILVIKK